jgi:hypothetical protein
MNADRLPGRGCTKLDLAELCADLAAHFAPLSPRHRDQRQGALLALAIGRDPPV